MGKPLLDVLREVAMDPARQAEFSGDPSGYLAQYGYEDVPADDVSEVLSLVADTLPPDAAQVVTAAAPTAPPSPADELAGDPGGDLEGDFGVVTDDFDAFSAGATGAGPDLGDDGLDDGLGGDLGDDLGDDLDPDFGTGEVAAVGDGYDDGAFGEGSEVGSGFLDDDSPFGADDTGFAGGHDAGLPDEPGAGYDDPALDDGALDDHAGLPDDHGDHGPGDDDGAGDDPGDLPDDPGDFLDDIGSF